MTCILTDEELISLADRSSYDDLVKVANAAARKALEMAARECQKQGDACDPYDPCTDVRGRLDCADAIRELAKGYE